MQLFSLKKWLLLLLLISLWIAFFYFRLYHYLSFESLRANRQFLLQWTSEHYFLSVCIFIFLYTLCVAASIPGATFFTLIGGFLFGLWWGTLYTVISATLGATLIFIAIKMALANWVQKKSGTWLKQMEKGLRENAFYYLLLLRLAPIFPFWFVNVIPALLGVRLSIFVFSTFIGIIPGSFIYTAVGSGLGTVFDKNETPNLNIIFAPYIFLPLLGLALLTLAPVIYKKYARKKS